MDTVENILKEKDIRYEDKGKDFLVLCFSPDHEDSSASCRVDRETGIFNCFSCGYKGNIYTEFNKQENIIFSKATLLRRKISDLLSSALSVEIPTEAVLFDKDFRDISRVTYNQFNMYYTEDNINLPVVDIFGRVAAIVSRKIHSKEGNKYSVYPPRAPVPIFPIKAYGHTHVLCEGPFDFLNLYDKGVKGASCVFGAQNIKEIDTKLIPLKIQGVSRLLIMFDGDEAGESAARKLKTTIQLRTDFSVDIIPLPDGKDPGSLSQEEVNILRERYSF